jgi:hypothetical protein
MQAAFDTWEKPKRHPVQCAAMAATAICQKFLSDTSFQYDPKMNLKYQISTFNGHIIEPFL